MLNADTFIHVQGLKKVWAGSPGQVDFLCGQVPFQSHLPVRQDIRQVVCQLNH